MEPSEGLGCWGVVWYAAKYYGYEFPRFEERLAEICDHLDVARDRFKELFEEVKDPQAGDVVMFSIRANGICDHIGIMLDSVRFLHSYPNGGVCVSRLNSPVYTKRVAGIYRWHKQST
jgi:cell wall-associated NlpC family hydrolase